MKKRFLLIMVLFSSNLIISQYNKSKKDIAVINKLNKVANQIVIAKPDSAFVLGKEALFLSEKHHYRLGQAWANFIIARANLMKNDTKQTIHYNNLAIALCNKIILSKNTKFINEAKKVKGRAFSDIGNVYAKLSSLTRAQTYNIKGLKLATEIGDKEQQLGCLINISNVYLGLGNFEKALNTLLRALKISIDNKRSQETAIIYSNLANTYRIKSDYPKAIDYSLKSLKYFEKQDNKIRLGSALVIIGNIYLDLKDTLNALKYYQRSMKTFKGIKEINTEFHLAGVYANFGYIYSGRHEYKKAIVYMTKALNTFEKNGNNAALGEVYRALAGVYQRMKNINKAFEYYSKSSKIAEEVGDKMGLGISFYNIAYLFVIKKEYKNAEKYYLRALKIHENINATFEQGEAHIGLSYLYSKTNQPAKALDHYKKYISIRDSIFSEKNSKTINNMEIKHEYEKEKLVLKATHQKEIEKQHLIAEGKNRQQKTISLSVSIVLLFVIILTFFIFRSNRQKQKANSLITKQKQEVEYQKHLLENKNREILDSITYAKRIQSAILPQPKLVKEFLEDSFILYKPKDIVAGDFYWLEVVGDTVLFAAADCTGHGVPGAMVSVVCNNGLNRAVREFGLTNPNEILDKTRELVIQEFEKSDEDVKDGMDISLCALDTNTNVLKWSGANNPLWVLRKKELLEHKADKQPIGKHSGAKPFSLIELQLEKNDIIYIFTDGFQDQFGGPKEKKFRVAQMRDLFLSLTDKSMEEQRKIVDESFETWKGDLDLVDDVCVIGVRI